MSQNDCDCILLTFEEKSSIDVMHFYIIKLKRTDMQSTIKVICLSDRW